MVVLLLPSAIPRTMTEGRDRIGHGRASAGLDEQQIPDLPHDAQDGVREFRKRRRRMTALARK